MKLLASPAAERKGLAALLDAPQWVAVKKQLQTWAMKNNIPGIITGLMNGRGLSSSVRRVVRGYCIAGLIAICLASLAVSLLARSRRDSFALAPYWKGRSRALAVGLGILLGPLGIHRFYLGRIVTGMLHIAGTICFLLGAYLLGSASMVQFMLLTEEIVCGMLLFVIGLAFLIWRTLDVFCILFGGLIPKQKRRRKAQRA